MTDSGDFQNCTVLSVSLCSHLSLLIYYSIICPFSLSSLTRLLLPFHLNLFRLFSLNPSTKTCQHEAVSCRSPLLLPDQSLVVKVPDHDVAVAAAGEADLVVWGDGQSVAGGSRRRQLRLDARGGRGQIPDRQRAGLTANNQGSPVGEQLAGANVVVPVLIWHNKNNKYEHLYTVIYVVVLCNWLQDAKLSVLLQQEIKMLEELALVQQRKGDSSSKVCFYVQKNKGITW